MTSCANFGMRNQAVEAWILLHDAEAEELHETRGSRQLCRVSGLRGHLVHQTLKRCEAGGKPAGLELEIPAHWQLVHGGGGDRENACGSSFRDDACPECHVLQMTIADLLVQL